MVCLPPHPLRQADLLPTFSPSLSFPALSLRGGFCPSPFSPLLLFLLFSFYPGLGTLYWLPAPLSDLWHGLMVHCPLPPPKYLQYFT